jgi:hypothetical protein
MTKSAPWKSHYGESMTVDGKISTEELQQLNKKVAQIECLLEEGN